MQDVQITIAEMKATIEHLSTQSDKQYEHIIAKSDEQLKLLQAINGTVREHGEILAALEQWRKDHEVQTHGTIDKEIDNMRKRDWLGGIIASLVGFLTAIFSKP